MMALGPIDQLLGLNQPAKNQPENAKADGKADGDNAAKDQPAANAEQPGKTECAPHRPPKTGMRLPEQEVPLRPMSLASSYTNPPTPDQDAAPAPCVNNASRA